MTHHIILWKLKDEFTQSQKAEIKKAIKEGLPSSNVDLMLDSTFDSPESLKGYSVHPEHVAVADGRVRPYTAGRYCLDYED